MDAVAMDGPAATGKNTVGEAVARHLGWLFLDSGSMYRALTWAALRDGIDPDDEAGLATLADRVVIELIPAAAGTLVLVDHEDIGHRLRAPAVDEAVSRVSRWPAVRKRLIERQRHLAHEQPVVMAGRDIGTNVLQDARWKIYLDGSAEARARRRWREQQARGETVSFEAVLAAIEERDRQDSQRPVNPLAAAPDAVIVDTSDLDAAQVVARVLAIIQS